MRANGVELLHAELVGLQRQLVLQDGHRYVHGHGRMHQAVALIDRQLEFSCNQVAQHAADQRVRSAVTYRGIGGELEQQV